MKCFVNPVLANMMASTKPRMLAGDADGKAWDARFIHPVPHDTNYYLKCCVGGIVSCGGTHTLVTPLDVAKCNMQVFYYQCRNLIIIFPGRPRQV